ncbi:hypothetical protein FQN54_003196 [Arachnomyces sp. PD_36]|nr:hypothetical protein FQN54_003196 [Arachnomyces sp. PD_36]
MGWPLPDRRLDLEISGDGYQSEFTIGSTDGEDSEYGKKKRASSSKRAVAMAALSLSIFLAALDATIVTTPLPTISRKFNSSAGYTWIGSAYVLAQAAVGPVWGKFSDIWGRRPLVLGSIAIFFIGSAICGAAVDIAMLISGRTVQGIGAGGLIIMGNICISDMFPMRARATYFGLLGLIWAAASAVGPVLGGALTEKVSWRWCFYVNLPFAGLAFVIVFLYLDLKTPETPVLAGVKEIDWFGCLAVVGATVMFLLGLNFGGVTYSWLSVTVLCLIISGVVASGIFVGIEWKLTQHPIMPLRLFRSATNIATLLGCLLHAVAFICGIFFLPLYFQAVLGTSVLSAGFLLLPFALSTSIAAVVGGIYIKLTGRYADTIIYGFVLRVLGFGLLIDLPETRIWWKVILYQIIGGIGAGLSTQPLLVALQSNVSVDDFAVATATFGFIRNIGLSIGVVAGSAIFQNSLKNRALSLAESLGPEVANMVSGDEAIAEASSVNRLPSPVKEELRHLISASIRDIWIFSTIVAAVATVTILFINKARLCKDPDEFMTDSETDTQPTEKRRPERR